MKQIFIVSPAIILLWNFYSEGITFRLHVIKTSTNVFLSESLHTQANGILRFNAWLIPDYEKDGNFQKRIVKLMRLVPPCLTWWLRGQEDFSGMLDVRQNCILMVKKNNEEKTLKIWWKWRMVLEKMDYIFTNTRLGQKFKGNIDSCFVLHYMSLSSLPS